MKRIVSFFIYTTLLTGIPSASQAQEFFDDFNGTSIDTLLWKAANMVWGNVPDKITNGGVVSRNVSVSNGNLIIEAHGNNYQGAVNGFKQSTRVGGAIFTKREFASGRFEIRAKICPHPGALSAFWTYYYENDNYNHEIDFEMPGHNQAPNGPANSDLRYGLATCWRGVGKEQYHTVDTLFGNQADGNYHLYRFEWHTGGSGLEPRVEWYYDNVLITTNKNLNHVPSHAASFWIGIWFPWWIKESNFDTEYMYIDWIRITPYQEENDVYKDG
jgi:beta-glucanase (GH16 family)